MLFQLETKNVETGLVYKSPLFASFAEAREEARAVSKAGRRTVRVVQVAEPVVASCVHCEMLKNDDGKCYCDYVSEAKFANAVVESDARFRDQDGVCLCCGESCYRTVCALNCHPASTAKSERPFVESKAYDYASWLEGK